MHRLSLCIDFIEFARKEKASVQAGIECTMLVRGASADLDASQNLVPSLLGCPFHLLEGQCLDFSEIPPCLFQ